MLVIRHTVPTNSQHKSVQQRPPSTRIVLGGGDRHHVLLLAILHLHVLAAILGISRHFVLGRGRWQVEGVIDNQIQGHEFAHLAVESALAREEWIGRVLRNRPMVRRYWTAWDKHPSWVECSAKNKGIKLTAI